MKKAPSFQFYPADWLNDLKLQTCDMSAQGILINMICLMHQSDNYGYLLINGSKPDHKTIIKLLRTHHRTFINGVNQLLLCGALKQTEGGIYYCERMVKDEHIRQVRRESGLKGGNPNLKKGKPNPYYLDKQKDKQKTTPSSSSPPSSSNKKKIYKRKLPDNFILTEKLKTHALNKNIPENEIEEIFDHFKNHHQGKGTLMISWDKAWYTWIANSKRFDNRYKAFDENSYIDIYKED